MKTTLATVAFLATLAVAQQNVQTFNGNLGGAAPPVIEDQSNDRPFSVDGSTFLNQGAALQRSCAVQHTACAGQANSGADFDVSDCDAQRMFPRPKLTPAVSVLLFERSC